MRKIKYYLTVIFFTAFPVICQGVELDALKADFLQGNYRRVIFEGQAQVGQVNNRDAEELSYILGLSFLKENKLTAAQDCFRRILANASSKYRAQATLGLADTYLIGGNFQEAEDIYNKLISDDANSSQKAAILYRQSQSAFKKGNTQSGNEYLSKLKRDFPLSPELRFGRGFSLIEPMPSQNDISEYSVQVGFFTNIANANNFKDKLQDKNYPAYVESASGGFRVKVGRFKTRKEALDLESELSKEGFQTKACP